ncbi:undecaprenyl-diphosphate phosphatase [Klugiella xanthotipulae]|uniref:Undecaprenyl-diphosphatase n=1 Tax=Klugiella xanthotipulae TaxID=244735 RepID=A0A543HSX1_9MICO|nr:undecaprenyl-diphosphate phosphatase [Klugiella xanthotipulae]TQM61410.1 undecaprenyl-diphosphatase [Klugiella xanthotipulae]
MGFIEAIILGFVQGLTEFLPISSSAHLRIVGEFLPSGTDPGAAFTAITQLGTEAAVVVFFWKDITRIISRWFQALVGKLPRTDPDVLMGWWIILGSLPLVVLGVLFQEAIETTLRSLWIVAFTLIGFGLLLGWADYLGTKRKTLDDLNAKNGIIYGFAQALALIPGVSRSGGTITAGLLMGYDRPSAARYSFLLAIPAVIGSGFFQLVKSMDGSSPIGPIETGAATLVAFGVGFGIIAFLMSYISKRSFMPFVIYRILLGGVLIGLLSTGLISA